MQPVSLEQFTGALKHLYDDWFTKVVFLQWPLRILPSALCCW